MKIQTRIWDDELRWTNQDLEDRAPTADSEIVTVTFPSSPDTDQVVPTTLTPADPENIHYEVVRQNQAAIVYDSQAAGRSAWQPGYLILRCDTASAVVTLRLSVPR